MRIVVVIAAAASTAVFSVAAAQQGGDPPSAPAASIEPGAIVGPAPHTNPLPTLAPAGAELGEPIRGALPPPPTDADGDSYHVPSDCNDWDDSVHPGAADARGGGDDDCDGDVNG